MGRHRARPRRLPRRSGRSPSGSAATRGESTAPSPACQIDYEHLPPFAWRIADDLSLPHVWDIGRAFVDPAQRGGAPLGVVLAGQAAFTFGEALAGLRARRRCSGSALGVLFVHSRLAERAFVPYVVASQTVPILAIAPLVVVALKADWLSVMAVATYLTFFPVTIASMRGLRAFDPRVARAVPVVCRDPPTGALAAAPADVGAVPVLGLPGRRGRIGHRRDHRRADGGRRRRASAARSSTTTSTTRPARSGCGRRSSCARSSASSSSASSTWPSAILTRGRYRPVEGLL